LKAEKAARANDVAALERKSEAFLERTSEELQRELKAEKAAKAKIVAELKAEKAARANAVAALERTSEELQRTSEDLEKNSISKPYPPLKRKIPLIRTASKNHEKVEEVVDVDPPTLPMDKSFDERAKRVPSLILSRRPTIIYESEADVQYVVASSLKGILKLTELDDKVWVTYQYTLPRSPSMSSGGTTSTESSSMLSGSRQRVDLAFKDVSTSLPLAAVEVKPPDQGLELTNKWVLGQMFDYLHSLMHSHHYYREDSKGDREPSPAYGILTNGNEFRCCMLEEKTYQTGKRKLSCSRVMSVQEDYMEIVRSLCAFVASLVTLKVVPVRPFTDAFASRVIVLTNRKDVPQRCEERHLYAGSNSYKTIERTELKREAAKKKWDAVDSALWHTCLPDQSSLNRKRLYMVNKLGEGRCGVVHLCLFQNTNSDLGFDVCAVKITHNASFALTSFRSAVSESKKDKRMFDMEKKNWGTVHGDRFRVDVVTRCNVPMLVMPVFDKLSLEEMQDQAMKKGIRLMLEDIHNKGYYYKDVHWGNVMAYKPKEGAARVPIMIDMESLCPLKKPKNKDWITEAMKRLCVEKKSKKSSNSTSEKAVARHDS